ncbi:MAG: glycogen synthase [Candidatus Latescibacterota bacterium]|jgi:starch synthase|nr:MAG: glycogen synthase [Candidatus Latescibacterota bacterium]
MKTKNDLTLVLVTTEIVPFSKVGGLADVMGALPDELEKLGARVSIFTPLYSSIDRAAFGIAPVERCGPLAADVAGAAERFRLYSCLKPGTGVKTYFVENDRFYAREGIYTVPETGKAFPDEAERTIFFNRAVIAAMKALDMRPDVVHCNDFHSGLIPAYLALEEAGGERFSRTATVFSIHNLAYQGLFGRDFLDKAGLDRALFAPMGPFEFWGRVNVMKAAIHYSGVVSTVSKTYAEEIMSCEEFGCGLEGVLRARAGDLVGILNGIDMDAWDPSTDELIPKRFTPDRLAGKGECRTELLRAFALPPRSAGPVIGMVSRLVDQKGFDILAEAFEGIMALGVRLVVLGTGQEKYHELYWGLAKKYPKQFGLKLEFNNRIAHLIEAGSDYFLMPSRYEPCGLNQMYSLRYGTIPIVRATGGLLDTIAEISDGGAEGNGFTFAEYSADALLGAVRRAAAFYADKAALRTVRRRIMLEDHSWRRSAEEYLAMYERARSLAGMGLTK